MNNNVPKMEPGGTLKSEILILSFAFFFTCTIWTNLARFLLFHTYVVCSVLLLYWSSQKLFWSQVFPYCSPFTYDIVYRGFTRMFFTKSWILNLWYLDNMSRFSIYFSCWSLTTFSNIFSHLAFFFFVLGTFSIGVTVDVFPINRKNTCLWRCVYCFYHNISCYIPVVKYNFICYTFMIRLVIHTLYDVLQFNNIYFSEFKNIIHFIF